MNFGLRLCLPLLACWVMTGCAASEHETGSLPPGLDSGKTYVVRWTHEGNLSVETNAVVLQTSGKWIQLHFDEPWGSSPVQDMWLNSDNLQWIGRADQSLLLENGLSTLME